MMHSMRIQIVYYVIGNVMLVLVVLICAYHAEVTEWVHIANVQQVHLRMERVKYVRYVIPPAPLVQLSPTTVLLVRVIDSV